MPERLHWFGGDIGEFQDAVDAAGWDVECRQLERGRFQSRIDHLEFDDVAIEKGNWNRGIQILGAMMPDVVTVVFALDPLCPAEFSGVEIGAGEMFVAPPGCEVDIVTKSSAQLLSFRVAADKLDAATGSVTGGDSRVAVVRRMPRSTADRLRILVSELFQPSPSCWLTASDVSAEAIAIVAEILEPGLVRECRPTHAIRVFTRARDYVERHLDFEVPLEDICRATGTHERSLRRAFHRAVGMSPINYLTTRRLQHARKLLRAGVGSVTEVAMATGFSHLSRFSACYRSMFDELPSETRRARPTDALIRSSTE